jgi:hypothetical protein
MPTDTFQMPSASEWSVDLLGFIARFWGSFCLIGGPAAAIVMLAGGFWTGRTDPTRQAAGIFTIVVAVGLGLRWLSRAIIRRQRGWIWFAVAASLLFIIYDVSMASNHDLSARSRVQFGMYALLNFPILGMVLKDSMSKAKGARK